MKKKEVTFKCPKYFHLQKNYYRHRMAPFVLCNFISINISVILIISKISEVLIVIASSYIYIIFFKVIYIRINYIIYYIIDHYKILTSLLLGKYQNEIYEKNLLSQLIYYGLCIICANSFLK